MRPSQEFLASQVDAVRAGGGTADLVAAPDGGEYWVLCDAEGARFHVGKTRDGAFELVTDLAAYTELQSRGI